jgi:hypothetical protein
MTHCNLSDFATSYIEAALWSSTDHNDEPMDANFDVSDIAHKTLLQMKADCRVFFVAHEAAILCDDGPKGRDGASQAAMAGHDLWLTRCGHGAGFWDGDWPEPYATQLDEAASALGKVDLYLGDDGKVYA